MECIRVYTGAKLITSNMASEKKVILEVFHYIICAIHKQISAKVTTEIFPSPNVHGYFHL